MPFWKQPSPEKKQQRPQTKQEADESLLSLQAGGLPLQAQQRLGKEATAGHELFTSDLSVNEFLLTRQQGYQPLSQVMGSSIYHVGWQPTRSSSMSTMASELTVISDAHRQAAKLTLNRLEQEATTLKAHGIIGVRFTTRKYEWGEDLVEYMAIGTAIQLPNTSHPPLFLSNLSGQEFWALLQAGYYPVGLAVGYCAYYVSLGSLRTEWAKESAERLNSKYNSIADRKIAPFAKAISTARKTAMQRVVYMARVSGAASVVGMHIECDRKLFENEDNLDLFVQFSAIGTAISPQTKDHVIPKPLPTLSFTDLRPERYGETRELKLREE